MNAILRSLLTVVGIPTLIAAIYFGLFASDVYVSEASFAIRSAKSAGSGRGLSAILASPMVSAGSQDSMLVADYVQSHDMLREIQSRLDIRAHYSASSIDRFSRLDEDATADEMRKFFREHVDVQRDSHSDVLTIKVHAFNPEMAQNIASDVIELSEELVNDISTRMEADALKSARAEVDLAFQKVSMANVELTEFRNTNVSINPVAESNVVFGLVSGLEERITEAQAMLAEKRAYMRDSAPEVIALSNRVNALTKQLKFEKGKMLGDDGKKTGSLIADYQPLAMAEELAQQQYASALGSLELARIEAQRKKMYLVTFIEPSFADDAVEPKRLKDTLTVSIFAFLLYLIGGLMWSALRDHIGK